MMRATYDVFTTDEPSDCFPAGRKAIEIWFCDEIILL